MVDWMLAHRRDGIVGLGIDYRETDRPAELFWKAYRNAPPRRLPAHRACRRVRLRLGATWNPRSTCSASTASTMATPPSTTRPSPPAAPSAASLFTVVPTNSYYLRTLAPERWALDHPIRRMPAPGLRIHPNTDDPPLHQVDPDPLLAHDGRATSASASTTCAASC